MASAHAETEGSSRVEALRAEHAQTTSDLGTVSVLLQQLSQARLTAEVRASEETARVESIDKSEASIEMALSRAEAAEELAADRARRAHLLLSRYVTSGASAKSAESAPALCSLLHFATEDPRLSRCLTALQVIVGPHLCVRLTRSPENAIPLMEEARKRGGSVRVWPLSALDLRDHSSMHEPLQRRFGRDSVIRPCELVSSRTEEAVLAAFGTALIVSTDEVAGTLGREYGVQCVTMDGYIHEPGSLQGGHREGSKQPNLASILERQRATAAVFQARETVGQLRALLQTRRAALRAAVSLAFASANESKVSSTLRQLRERLEEAEEELDGAMTTIGEQSMRFDGAALYAEALRADLALLHRVQSDGGGGGGAGRRDAVASALAELAQRASHRSAKAHRQAEACEGEALRHDADLADGSTDFETAALLEEHQEQLAAFQAAVVSLSTAERAQGQSERAARETSEAAAASAQLEGAVRAEIRRLSVQLETATATAKATEAVEEAGSRQATAVDIAAADIAARWLVAESGFEEEGEEEDDADAQLVAGDEEEEGDAEELVAGLTDEERRCKAAAGDRSGDSAAGGGGGGGSGGSGGSDGSDGSDGSGGIGGSGELTASERLASLSSRLEAGELLLEAWRQKRQEVERTHGSRAMLRTLLAASSEASRQREGGGGCADGDRRGSSRLRELEALQLKAATVTSSVERLTTGIDHMKQRVALANAEAVRHVRQGTKAVFERLVPGVEVDIACADPEALGESGACFATRRRGGDGGASGRGESGCGWRDGLNELSGGQRTLLNLALLLAVAGHRPSMIILVDEVDAALDESNAARVATLLKELSKRSQVIAVSHRAEFQRAADPDSYIS